MISEGIEVTMAVLAHEESRHIHNSGKELNFFFLICDMIKNTQYNLINLNVKELQCLYQKIKAFFI